MDSEEGNEDDCNGCDDDDDNDDVPSGKLEPNPPKDVPPDGMKNISMEESLRQYCRR